MLIHSVTPAHMLTEQPALPAYTVRQTSMGYLEGEETPQGFRVQRVYSTDPAAYLRADLSPGGIYRGE